MALYLTRCEPSARASVPVRLARLHPEQEVQVYVALDDGTLQHVLLGPSGEEAVVLAQFMLLLQPEDGAMHAVHRKWSDFQLHEGGVVFSQQGSSKLLFAQLPLQTDEPSAIFLFGSHAGEVLVLTKLGSLLVSGCADGVLKMWDLDDGQLSDTKVEPGGPRITALQGVGPFMVAVGSHDGTVTILDITTQKLKAVHRFHAGPGPVTALAACLPPQLSAKVAVAEGSRSYDGGGVVEPPMGLPWRLTPAVLQAGAEAWRTGALLAVASTAGWLNLYSPVAPGVAEPCWAQQHSATHHGYPRLAFTSHGSFLALASGTDSSSILLLDTASWAVAKQWALPCRTSALLLDPRGSEERVLGGGLPAMPDLSMVPPSAGLQVVPMVRVTLCAAPEHGMPLLLEARVPPPSPQRQGEGTFTSPRASSVLAKPQSAPSSLPAPFSPKRVPRGPAMELPTAPPYCLSSATLGLMGQLSSHGQMGQLAGSVQAAQSPSDGQTGLPSSAGQWVQSAAAWWAPGAASSGAPEAGYVPASNSGSASAGGGAIGWQPAPHQHAEASAPGSRVVGSTGEWKSGLAQTSQAHVHLSPEQADRTVAAWASSSGSAVHSTGGAAAVASVQLLHGASPYSPAALPMQGLSAAAAAAPWQRGSVSGAGAADSTDGADGALRAAGRHGGSDLMTAGYSAASGQSPWGVTWTAASLVRQQLPDVTAGLQPLSTGAVGAAAAVSSTATGMRMGMRPGTLPGARSWLTGAPPPSLEGLLAQASSNTQPHVSAPSNTSTQPWAASEDPSARAPSAASEVAKQLEVVRVQPAHAMGQRHARPEPFSATRYFCISDDDFDDSGAMRAVQGSEQGLGQRQGLSGVREDEEEQGQEQRQEIHMAACADAAHGASGEETLVAEQAHKVEEMSSGQKPDEEQAEEEGEEEPLPRHQLSVEETTGNIPVTAGELGQMEGLDRQGSEAEEDEEPAPRPVPGYLHGWGQGGAATTATTPASRLPAQQHCRDSDEWPSSQQERQEPARPSWLQHPLQQSQDNSSYQGGHPAPLPADRRSDVHPSHSANLQHQGGGSLSTETGSDVTVSLGKDTTRVADEGNWRQLDQEMQDEAAEHGPQQHQQQQEQALEAAPAPGRELLRGRGEGDYRAVDFVSQVPASPGAGAQSRGTSTVPYEGQAGSRDASQAPGAAQKDSHGDRPDASRPQHREQLFAGRLEMGEVPPVQQQQQQGEGGGQSLAEGLSQPQARMQADPARAQGQRGRTRFLGYKPNTAQLLRQLRAQAREAAAQPSSAGPGQGTALAAQAKGSRSRPLAGRVSVTVAGPRSRAAAAGGQGDGGGAAGAWSLRGRGHSGCLPGLPAAAGADAGGTPEPDVGLSPDQGAGSKRVGGMNAWERRGTPSKAGRGAGGAAGMGLGQARGYGRARGAQPQRAADGSIVSFPGGGSVYIPSGASSPATLPSLASPMLMGSPSDALFSRPAGAHGYQQQSLLSASGFSWQPTPAAAAAGAGGHAGPSSGGVTSHWHHPNGGGGAGGGVGAGGGSGATRAAGLGMEKAEGGVNDVSRAGDNAAADWDGTRTPSGQLVPFGDAGAADWGIDHAIAMAKLAGAGEGELARPALCGTGLMLDRLQQLKLGQAPLPPSSPEARQAQNQEALRAAARAVTNLSPDVALYPDLPGLNPDPSSQRLPKQLHPGWLASKQRRPDMGALWSAAEQQHGVCGTRPMAMYERPQASSVAAVVLL